MGDNSFADKCLAKMNDFKAKKKTILFVSHSVNQMKEFCDRVIWLHHGHVLGDELPDRILMPYCYFAREFNMMTVEERQQKIPSLEEYQKKYL